MSHHSEQEGRENGLEPVGDGALGAFSTGALV